MLQTILEVITVFRGFSIISYQGATLGESYTPQVVLGRSQQNRKLGSNPLKSC